VKTCKKCGFLERDCICKEAKREEIVICPRCNTKTRHKYMKACENTEVCSNCLVIAGIALEDIEYYTMLSEKYGLKLYDIGTHIQAANHLSQSIESYLASLPKTQEEFIAYFKGKKAETLARSMVE